MQHSPVPTKKLINNAENCVEDSLTGFVKSHFGIALLKKHRIVFLENIKKICKKGLVTILSGGGSGHEPFAAGYVGRGMLTAAVSGAIFTSPPPSSVFAAIQLLACNNAGGTLVLVANYTGDRLTFGQAVERAKAEGLQVEMVLIGEDCAIANPNKATGRRGLCGMVLMQKIAGALAEEGRSLKEIVDIVSSAAAKMGTIGICLSPCSLPGSGPLFQIPPDEIELGLGIHGEAGIKKLKIKGVGVNIIVEKMISHMSDPESACCLPLEEGNQVAVIVNNLGGLSQLEMSIVAKEVLEFLQHSRIRVERCYVGTFQTSLDMVGVSLTILLVDELLLKCLDAPTDAPSWLQAGKGLIMPEHKINEERYLPKMEINEETKLEETSPTLLNNDDRKLFAKIIHNACTAVEEQEQKLNTLDSGCGDGDCGTTLKIGAQAIQSQLDMGMPLHNPKAMFLQLGTIAADNMGGVSGGLYSIFFTAASKALNSAPTMSDWCHALELGIQSVMQYGGAEPGDRTMLDALHAAHEMLVAQVQLGSRAVAALTEAVAAAKEATSNTSAMKPKVGRSSYVSMEHLGQPDAGAMAVTILLQAILDTLITDF